MPLEPRLRCSCTTTTVRRKDLNSCAAMESSHVQEDAALAPSAPVHHEKPYRSPWPSWIHLRSPHVARILDVYVQVGRRRNTNCTKPVIRRATGYGLRFIEIVKCLGANNVFGETFWAVFLELYFAGAGGVGWDGAGELRRLGWAGGLGLEPAAGGLGLGCQPQPQPASPLAAP